MLDIAGQVVWNFEVIVAVNVLAIRTVIVYTLYEGIVYIFIH